MGYAEFYRRSIEDRDGFWAEQARLIDWQQPLRHGLRLQPAAVRALVRRRHDQPLPQRGRPPPRRRAPTSTALIYVSTETGERAQSTPSRELHAEVQRMAADAAVRWACGKGDRVLIYMPMIPEAAFAMLACARIGAIHSVVFGGFAAVSLASRIDDAEPKRDRHRRRRHRAAARSIAYKPLLDEAIRLAAHKPATVLLVDRGLAPMERVAGPRRTTTPRCAQRHRRRAGAVRLARVARDAELHPLHLRHHRQAQGRAARHRRLRGGAGRVSMKHIFCGEPGETYLLHQRHRLGGRPLATSSTGR